MPEAPPTAAAALVAPIAHCTHMEQAYRPRNVLIITTIC